MQRPWGGKCLKVLGESKVKLQSNSLKGGSCDSLCAGLRWIF